MEPVKSVSLYHRLPNGKYEYCVPQGIYIRGTKFALRLYEAGHRSWEPLLEGIDFVTAKRIASKREDSLLGGEIAENHHSPVEAAQGKRVLRSIYLSLIKHLKDNDLSLD
jgi:hypothetical protein